MQLSLYNSRLFINGDPIIYIFKILEIIVFLNYGIYAMLILVIGILGILMAFFYGFFSKVLGL